jgi:prophage maintenance system killer protein
VGEARAAIGRLKADLIGRGEATDLFGREREEGLAALLGNLDQSVFGEPAYPTVESKAAHLLYFTIKNHPFSDGNKRIGSFLFVDFLNRNGRLFRDGEAVINDVGLDANTRAVFGDYISVYDIQRAVFDGATVPIYYESRLAKLELKESERPKIDPQVEEATEGEEVERKEKLQSQWAQLKARVGSANQICQSRRGSEYGWNSARAEFMLPARHWGAAPCCDRFCAG